MTTTLKNPKDDCGICGGELSPTTITHEERRGDEIYLFQNVPALVCKACGEIWIEEKTLQQIDRLLKTGRPVRKVEAPVFDFALDRAKT